MMEGRGEEVVVGLPSPRNLAPRTTHVRGGWLSSSLRTLREGGYYTRYMAALPEDHRATMSALAAGEWLPIEVAIAHYAACDRLDIPVNELVGIGTTAARYANHAVISVAAKLATGAGATPWTIYGQAQRLWDRTFMGGAVGVTKLGPKEMRLEVVGWPCAGYRHTRIGLRGVLTGVAEYFCTKAYAREIENLCTPLTLGYRLAWA